MNTSIKPFTTIIPKVTFLIKQLGIDFRKNTGRPLALSTVEIISIGILWKKQGIITKKSLYDLVSPECSYKTLVVLLNRFLLQILIVLTVCMKENSNHAHVIKHTDATDIPVCLNKNAKYHRTMKDVASFGYSGKGFYYGIKMNITTDLTGKLLAIWFTSANGNDRETFLKMNKSLHGIFVADSGYIGEDLAKKFFVENRRILFAKPKANMKKVATELNNKLYDTRMLIERHFRNLKEFNLLVTHLPRSINGYLGNYLFALLA